MNVFEAVKQSVTTRQAVEYYGLQVNQFNKTCCPFHDDRTPSMKVDQRFHCFGCGADGNVIDFVSRLYRLDAKAAAEKLAADFLIPYEQSKRQKAKKHSSEVKTEEQRYCAFERTCVQVLADYLCLLRQWESRYAPQAGDASWHPLFVEALQQKDRIGYLLDVLQCAPIEGRAALINDYGWEVIQLEQRLSELGTGTERKTEDDDGGAGLPDGGGSEEAAGLQRERASEEQHGECVSGLYE